MKLFLSEKLQPYLRAHYGDQSSELLELILKENILRISDILMEEGDLKALALQNGITPTMNVERHSSKKIVGSHPLSSNKVRKFTVQCSKQNMGSNRPYDITIKIVQLLFTAVRTVQQHEIALIPIRSNSGAPKLWDTDLIAREQHKLRWESTLITYNPNNGRTDKPNLKFVLKQRWISTFSSKNHLAEKYWGSILVPPTGSKNIFRTQ